MATNEDIFIFAREVLQTDETDLTNLMMFTFVNDATDRILNLRNNWAHLYTEGTLSVVSGDNVYALSSGSFTPTTYNAIESVWDDDGFGRALMHVEYQEASAYFIGTNQTTSDRPSMFSVYGGNLYLYPIPSGTRTFRVAGYRLRNEAEALGSTPDIPEQFHAAIKYGVVSLALGQSEDYEGAEWWGRMANQAATTALRNHFSNVTNRPIQLHGRHNFPRFGYADWVRNGVV